MAYKMEMIAFFNFLELDKNMLFVRFFIRHSLISIKYIEEEVQNVVAI